MSYKLVLAAGALAAGIACQGAIPKADPSAPFVRSDSDPNPYTAISTRNVFGLLPAPSPTPVAQEDPVASSQLKLTGFIKVEGQQIHALFASVSKDAKETSFFNLKEGERDGVLECVKILEDKEAAEVILGGNHLTVMLKDSKPAGGGGGGGAPGPGVPAGPGLVPISGPKIAQGGGAVFDPTSTSGRVVVAGAAPVSERVVGSGPNPAEGNPLIAGAYGSVPSRTQPSNQMLAPTTADESHLRMAADALLHENDPKPYPPLLPPIADSLARSGGTSGTGSAGTDSSQGPPALPDPSQGPPSLPDPAKYKSRFHR